MIRLSIALVTRNRPESLERTLQNLRSQSFQPFEIVVSDDSDGELAAKTASVAKRWNCRYITGPHRGLYANRNYSALACRGTHIRTMDDDHILPENHLEQCFNAVSSDPHSLWTTGEIGYVNGQFFGESKTAQQLCPSGVGEAVENMDNNWAIADGSTIYPKTVFDRGYRMIEDYKYGSSYLEFGIYLYRHGFRSRCVPNAYIEHYADSWTIERNDRDTIESRLYASLCFNLYFQKNPTLAAKYILLYIWLLKTHENVFVRFPQVFKNVRERWMSLS
ncbi:glycosyltransferase [Lusitaniella coriacea LEGE 07157]|uniref:Glycosyltransferase n=1 Tax=Lusitaniella coriacea LEGE 07157 TaxID=945747 RepID=A0A8J7DZ55_9CYAN|nr:glycosyltransferase [Lusitaniella coriacea]MBE9118269.1 glycosyltransferase [Lusitaniella coriacea LEGE 07157]